MFESSGRSPGVQFALGMDQLDQALDTLAEIDYSEVDAQCLGQRLLELLGHSRRLGAVKAMVADRFSASGVWGDAGAKSARAWIASQSNEPAGRIAAVLTTGKGMRWHEQMAQAFTAGEVSARHLDLLAAAGAKYPQLRGMLYEHAEVIVEVARYATPARFAQELEAICHRFDPAAVDADERQRDSQAYVHLSPIADGMWRLDGLLPAEVGTQFAAVLDAARRRLRAEAKDAGEGGEGVQGDGDLEMSGGSSGRDKERTDGNAGPRDVAGLGGVDARDKERADGNQPERSDGDLSGDAGGEFAQETWPNGDDFGQVSRAKSESEVVGIDVLGNPIYADETPVQARDHRFGSRQNIDALRLMLNLVAPATNPDGTIALPSVNGARPVVHLTVDIASLLEDSQNTAAAWLERFGVPATVISAAKATLLACDATIEPMIMRDGHLVATLPTLQTVPAHLRKAVMMRDRQCRINSCRSAIAEIHHLIFLSQGGPTTMDNLAGLCWFHHHMIHHGHWTLTGDANHELTLTNTTTGQHWTNRPPRRPDLRGREQRKRE